MIVFRIKKLISLPVTTGFSVVEVIVAVAIFSTLVFGVTSLLISIIQNPKLQLKTINAIDEARIVSSRFANEIRAAAYGSYPLIKADDSEIIFYSPFGASSGKINRIRYYISGDTLYKGIIVPVNGIYNPATETVTAVFVGILNKYKGVPLFYYYDGNYNGVTNIEPLSQPVNITQVRFVKMNLISQYQITAQNSKEFSLHAGATIRILKDNLND